MRIRFRVTHSDDGTVQIVKPGGKLVVTLARDRFLKRYHFFTYYWDGRSRGRRHRPARPLQAAGQTARPGPHPGPAGGDQAAPGAAGPSRRRLPARGGRRPALSDILAGAGVLVAAQPRPRPRSCCRPGRAALGGDAGRARPLPGADPRRPVALAADRRPARRHRPAGRARRRRRRGRRRLLAAAFRRWPIVLPLAIVAALPFRVPLHAGGDTANLLVPLYLVIAGGVLAAALPGLGARRRRQLRHPRRTRRPPPAPWLPPSPRRASSSSTPCRPSTPPDFSKGLQNVCFFFVPFSLVYALLRDVEWDRRLLDAGPLGGRASRRSPSSSSARSST